MAVGLAGETAARRAAAVHKPGLATILRRSMAVPIAPDLRARNAIRKRAHLLFRDRVRQRARPVLTIAILFII